MKLIVLMLASISVFGATNKELERKLDVLADEIAALKASQSQIGSSETVYGLGQSASKVYFLNQGISIGGYGEITYNLPDTENEDGDANERDPETEVLRNIIYLGYKYNDNWVLNTEIEIEHADEIFAEFVYVDYLHSDAFNMRFGLSLIPMGLVNELHEPIYFNSVNRPEVEKFLIPTTWRENGVGVFGTKGKFSYKAFLFNGPDGSAIAKNQLATESRSGIRSGRKKGGVKENASTGMLVFNGEYDFNSSANLGLSIARVAGSNSSTTSNEALGMNITEIHGTYKKQGLGFKFLAAQVDFVNSDDWNDANSDKVPEKMHGFYVEAEYDIEGKKGSVYTPFIRFSEYDLRAETDEAVLAKDSSLYRTNTVVGLAFKPIDRIVIKADYAYKHRGDKTGVNEFNLGLGFVY